MKTKYFFLLLFVVTVTTQFRASAQEAAKRIIELKLTDPVTKMSHTYLLNGANYLVSNPYSFDTEAQSSIEGNCSINLDLSQDMDPFFLKWVSGEMADAIGVITLSSNEGLKKPRTISFTGGKVVGSSESFFNTDYVTGRQISLIAKTLSIDDTIVLNLDKKGK